jgi:hypothetical protein
MGETRARVMEDLIWHSGDGSDVGREGGDVGREGTRGRDERHRGHRGPNCGCPCRGFASPASPSCACVVKVVMPCKQRLGQPSRWH